jgi:RNA polymerase sigma factor (sigma-70 family)
MDQNWPYSGLGSSSDGWAVANWPFESRRSNFSYLNSDWVWLCSSQELSSRTSHFTRNSRIFLLTDQELIRGFLAGAKQENAKILDWITICLRSNSQNARIDLDDVIADTRLKLLLVFEKGAFRYDSSLKTFVHGVAYNTLIDAIRRRKRLFPLDDNTEPSDPSNPHTQLEEIEQLVLLDRGMAMLSDDCQRLLEMALVEKLSTEGLAKRLGVTEGAAKTRLSRCKKELISIVRRLM